MAEFTFAQLAQKFDALPDLILANKEQIQTEMSLTILGNMLQRIFIDGKDADGGSIGKYSEKYAKFREAQGPQVAYVDLQFKGDLFNSVQLGTEGDDVVIGIINELENTKAATNERRFGKEIFRASADEIAKADKAFVLSLQAIIKKSLGDN